MIRRAFLRCFSMKGGQPGARWGGERESWWREPCVDLDQATPAHLQDHLGPGHPLHHDLGVAGRSLAENLGADGREVQQDRLQGVSVQEELETGRQTQVRGQRSDR